MKNLLAIFQLITVSFFVLPIGAQELDSVAARQKVYRFQFQQIPEIYRSIERFTVNYDYGEQPQIHDFNFKVQQFLQQNNRGTYSLADNFRFLKEHSFDFGGDLKSVSYPDLYRSIWRSRMIDIREVAHLRNYINYGTNFLIQSGVTDLQEYMRFVNLLMQEQLDFHYDPNRLRLTGGNSEGIVDLVDILKTFNTRDKIAVAGVCRDVHEMGARMMREICASYYAHNYPGRRFDFDKYIFVQSWATQASQHMTISFIDPVETGKVYELDWGRLTEKQNSLGYDHGRNYGNSYRIWKFDPKRQYMKAIDSKRTALGNLLDDYLYNDQDFDSFSGIKNVEPYSAADLKKLFKSGINFNLAFGTMVQNQKFALSSLSYRTRKKSDSALLQLSCQFSLQTLVMEELDKKNLMYPHYNFTTALVFYEYPRIIARLKTRALRIRENVEATLYADNSVESIIYQDFFNATDIKKYNGATQSADGAIQLTHGLKIRFKTVKKNLDAEVKIQNRGFLAAREVRLMSGNMGSLISNAVMVSPAQDLVVKWNYIPNSQFRFGGKSVLELTNQQNLLFFQQISFFEKFRKMGFINLDMGLSKMLSGFPYFWYPVNRTWIGLSFLNRGQNTKVGMSLQQFNDRELTVSAQASFSW